MTKTAPAIEAPLPSSTSRRCRSCAAPLVRLFVDLGMSPPCEDFLTVDRLDGEETFYPLDVRICDQCLLVQLPTYLGAESIFTEYAYFSSFSDSWVAHAGRLVEEATRRQDLGPTSRVVEVASNDGYLLQHVIARGIPALGVEPARNIASVASDKGIPTLNEFFTEATARRIVANDGPADWIVANNVFAHVPELNDFTAGLAALLAPDGLLAIEVGYLVRLIEGVEFDTIYHEHFMYYTVLSAEAALARHGLRIIDVEHLETHGGSIRLWVVHDDDPRPSRPAVEAVKAAERQARYGHVDGYVGFADRVAATKRELLAFLIRERARVVPAGPRKPVVKRDVAYLH